MDQSQDFAIVSSGPDNIEKAVNEIQQCKLSIVKSQNELAALDQQLNRLINVKDEMDRRLERSMSQIEDLKDALTGANDGIAAELISNIPIFNVLKEKIIKLKDMVSIEEDNRIDLIKEMIRDAENEPEKLSEQ